MKTLIMVPGMMCDRRLFDPQIDRFSDGIDIIVPELRGRSTINGFANAILVSAPPTFSLLGLSMGGIIAMEILRLARDRVERVALLDTNPFEEKDEMKRKRGPQIEAARSGRLAEIMRDEMKPNYLVDSENKQSILDLCMEMALSLGPTTFEEQSKALMNRIDQIQTLKMTDIPALILCGREDLLCPVERHELMHSLMQNSTLSVVEKAGHMPVLEQPDVTNAHIAEWLNR